MVNRIEEIGASLGPQAEELKEMALVYTAAARERLAEGSERAKQYIIKEPVRAMGIALGLGVFLGWLIKRR